MKSTHAAFYSTMVLFLGALLALAGSQGSIEVSNLPLFAVLGLIAYGIQVLVFIPSYLLKTEHFYDLTGSLTFISITLFALFSLPEPQITQQLLAAVIVLWALRLGGFLFWRVHKFGGDDRFEHVKGRFFPFLMYWMIQGLWIYLTLAAALAALTSTHASPFSALELIGLCVWVFGFSVETIADLQKTKFKLDASNKGKFIQNGLWSWSRHPNYFGEIVLWLGVALMTVESLAGWQLVTLISPIFVIILLTKVSGIPLLEEKVQKKWGDSEEYQAYAARTSKLILRPPLKS